jgi:hypothetical protein
MGPQDRQCNLTPPEPRGLAFRRYASPWPSAWPRCEYAASCLIYGDFSKVSAVVSSSGAHKMNSWRPSHQENGT